MKIHIIGVSGSGKSYLADILSRNYGIAHYDLDHLFWDIQSSSYNTKMPVERRAAMLSKILDEENWIIEGVYYAWLSESFKKADYIILLDIPQRVYKYRIRKRFIRRKLGLEQGEKESLQSLKNLLSWTDHFQKNNLPEIYQILQEYKDKLIVVHNSKELQIAQAKLSFIE